MRRIYEKKDHLIMRNPNLKDGEKTEIIRLLNKHPSYENKIEWNKNKSLTYEDFLSVLRPLYINDLDPRGLVEGQDYDILYESEDEVLYSIYSYDASKILASNSVEPKIWTKIPSWCGEEEFNDEAHAFGHFDSEHGNMKPGAKWCISMQTSNRYWNQYSSDFQFFFWFRNNNRLRTNKKIAIGVYKSTWGIALLYNGADNEIRTPLPSYITEAIENEKEGYKEKEFNRIKYRLKLNPHTNRYDYDGDLNRGILKNFVSDNYDGFTINFGEVTGNFNCSGLSLISLKGAPQKIGGSFYCPRNQLTSLEGAPRNVGKDFYCSENQLTSLAGAPQIVSKDFWCHNNHLTSLEGAPQIIGGEFNCQSNQLTSLEGAPQEVGGIFNCYGNKLTSLEGAPQIVGEHFNCSGNKLTSLEGAPKEVGGWFYCSWNELTSLKGAPKTVGRYFNCSNNQLTSLEGAPQEVGGNFECSWNELTSLKGAPKTVGGDFYCHYNPDLHSLDGIGEVKGEIIKDF